MIKKIALFALLCALTFQHTVLAASGVTTTVIVNPPGQQIALEHWHSTHSPNHLPGAQWVWKSGGQGWLDGDSVWFETIFFVDCTSGEITLKITADNEFSASLNGGAPVTGNDWNIVYSFTMSGVACGVNMLRTRVINRHDHTPAALIFLIEQDQTQCYKCAGISSFYSRSTCQCECTNPWNRYPSNLMRNY
jgi:hypothetical protein